MMPSNQFKMSKAAPFSGNNTIIGINPDGGLVVNWGGCWGVMACMNTIYNDDPNAFDETDYIDQVMAVNFFGTYAAQDQTILIASVCGGVAFVLLVAAVLTVFIIKTKK